jgi:hypothetical protein
MSMTKEEREKFENFYKELQEETEKKSKIFHEQEKEIYKKREKNRIFEKIIDGSIIGTGFIMMLPIFEKNMKTKSLATGMLTMVLGIFSMPINKREYLIEANQKRNIAMEYKALNSKIKHHMGIPFQFGVDYEKEKEKSNEFNEELIKLNKEYLFQ